MKDKNDLIMGEIIFKIFTQWNMQLFSIQYEILSPLLTLEILIWILNRANQQI